jgi:TetR/AcrR family transcriptional regulator, repressor for neighboring sulfatase
MDKPRGKDAVTKAIIEAAIPLVAERGVKDVSFRDIAVAANVNHGLITHYFGNKEELMHRVSLHLSDEMIGAVKARGDDYRDMWERVFSGNSVRLRAMVRIMLDTPVDKSASSLRFVDETIAWLKAEQDKYGLTPDFDSDFLMYLAASLLIGGEIIGPHLKEVLHLSDEAFDKLKHRVLDVLIHEVLGPGPSRPA